MLLVIVLFCLAILGLLLDSYIFFRNIRGLQKRWLSRLYITQSVIINLGMVVVMSLYEALIGTTTNNMVVVMWLIYIFLVSFIPKFIFVIFSLLELLGAWIFGRRLRAMLYIGLSIGLLAVGTMLWGTVITRNNIVIKHIDIVSEDLPESFDGFTIAQFSDTHLGNLGCNVSLIEQMVDDINELNPDIIVQSGDLVNAYSSEFSPKYQAIFRQLKAPVYSVLGNHDLGIYISDTTVTTPEQSLADIMDLQKKIGWQLLDNEHLWLRYKSDSIIIAGVRYPDKAKMGLNSGHKSDPTSLIATMTGVPDSAFTVLIAHTPAMWDMVPQYAPQVDLMLSGHVHAGQMKIFGFSPAKMLYPLWSGLYTDRGRNLYINDGIGYVAYPMRIGANPEITLFTLKTK